MLDSSAGALKTMLTPFKLGVGGPVAGGDQYMPWIHVDDVAGMYVAGDRRRGLERAGQRQRARSRSRTASSPRPSAARSHRPAVLPVPGLALKALYGQMSEIVLEGQRAVPAKALELGYEYEHPDLDEALRAALR